MPKLNLGRYSKAIMAVLGQALAFAEQFYGHNPYVAMAVSAFGALGVYAVPNAGASAAAGPVISPASQPPVPALTAGPAAPSSSVTPEVEAARAALAAAQAKAGAQ